MSSNPGYASLREELLFKKLDTARGYRLTLISAPADAGKTRLLNAWAAAHLPQDDRLAWMALTPDDDVPEEFIRHLAVTISILQGRDVLPHLPLDPLDGAVDLINSLADISREVFLVLDGYHLIQSAKVHQVVEMILDYLPPRVHMILTSRDEPPLPIPRLRVRRQLLEIELEPPEPAQPAPDPNPSN